MNRLELVKEAWKEVTKREIVGWLFFTGVLSILFAKYTLFWEMGNDKLEFSWLVYRAVMVIFFVSLTGFLVKKGFEWVNDGTNETEPNELIRAFSAQVLIGLTLVFTLFVEVVSLSVRGSQLLEYIQGMLYFGVGTGFGMVLYLLAINYVSKKERGQQEV